ncbi:MAG: hypothetical protein GXP35_14700 [Actinobacteria bacterium]|nr:hypothetical protein [Actinomycetota bacterium]
MTAIKRRAVFIVVGMLAASLSIVQAPEASAASGWWGCAGGSLSGTTPLNGNSAIWNVNSQAPDLRYEITLPAWGAGIMNSWLHTDHKSKGVTAFVLGSYNSLEHSVSIQGPSAPYRATGMTIKFDPPPAPLFPSYAWAYGSEDVPEESCANPFGKSLWQSAAGASHHYLGNNIIGNDGRRWESPAQICVYAGAGHGFSSSFSWTGVSMGSLSGGSGGCKPYPYEPARSAQYFSVSTYRYNTTTWQGFWGSTTFNIR